MKKNVYYLIPLALFFPLITHAQTFASLVGRVVSVINAAIPVVALLILVVFFWGIARYIFSSEPDEKGKGRGMMVWGLVALIVAFSVWGIVTIIKNALIK